MTHPKLPLTLDEQIAQLTSRGMIFSDEGYAIPKTPLLLSAISSVFCSELAAVMRGEQTLKADG